MNSDYLNLDSFLQPEEKALRDNVRRFVDERCAPNVREWFEPQPENRRRGARRRGPSVIVPKTQVPSDLIDRFLA